MAGVKVPTDLSCTPIPMKMVIKKMTTTPGNVHDSLHDFGEFEHLLGDRHGQVYADSAYANKDNDQKLGKENNRILHRAYRNTPLTEQQKAQNKMYSSVCYVVERTFGLLKLHHGLGKARYMGLARNKTRAHLIAMSHNLKTGMNIFKQLRLLQESCA